MSKLNEVCQTINSICPDARVLIYGAGEHTARLLQMTELSTKTVIGIVDRKLCGQTLSGYQIFSPADIPQLDPEVILISSHNYQKEIHTYLKEEMAFKGEIITLYSESDSLPFYLMPYVKTVNYQVNNYCNSRCVMCNVWKLNDHQFLSCEDFDKALADPLFYNVESIGFSGGEPTLVKNLPDYFLVAINRLPFLKSMSLITNSILFEKIGDHLLSIYDLCIKHKKDFSVMLSLDGIGDVHDKNRGVPGNFEKIIHLIDFLTFHQIPFLTGTTITRNNVWDLECILAFLKINKIYGRFRIAEFINRLENDTEDCQHCIRNFTDDEIYQLTLFFKKLEYGYETNELYQNTYKNIGHMLQGGSRIVECPYGNGEAVNLDCHGNLAYCAPKSPIIGNLFCESGLTIYETNQNIMDAEIIKFCGNCIHDYHGKLKQEYIDLQNEENYYRNLIKTAQYKKAKETCPAGSYSRKTTSYQIFIVGWYGTETVGDKAILGGLADYYQNRYPDLSISIGSLYPFVTERTVKELNIKAEVVPVYSQSFFETAAVADEIVVGGGPLMELEELALIEWAFYLARKNNHQRTVFGCGIGPLYTEEKVEAVSEILTLADTIYLRDRKSVDYARELCGRDDIRLMGDPAIPYIQKLEKIIEPDPANEFVACFFRELTFEYRGSMNYAEFERFKGRFEAALVENLLFLLNKLGITPCLYAMHNFVAGNDDRDFNYSLLFKYFKDEPVLIEEQLSTVKSTIKAMKSSKLNLCMRYHSVLFADSLGTPFIAIDYTNGGKIKSYLEDRHLIHHLVTMDQIINDVDALYRCYKNIYG